MAQLWTDADGADAAAAATAAVAAHGGRALRVVPGERSGSWKVHLVDVDTGALASAPGRRRLVWARRGMAAVLLLSAVGIGAQQREVAADWKERAEDTQEELEEQQSRLASLQEALERSEATVADLEDDVERLAAELAARDDVAVSGSGGG